MSHNKHLPLMACHYACQLSVKDTLILDSVCLIFVAAPLLHTRVLLHCVSNEIYFVFSFKVFKSYKTIVHMQN